MDSLSINTPSPEEYQKAVQASLDYVREFFVKNIESSPGQYLSIVKDNPDRLEEQLNTIQIYINFTHRLYLDDIQSFIISTMVGTQIAFLLGYRAGQKDALDDVPLPQAFQNLSLDKEE